jgi:glycogen operon protein
LVSYERKHNEANGEDNRDGNSDNASRNWGVEGETRSAQVSRLRDRMMKNMLATLAFSQGVPMISHGDELGRTQKGNNNAYCQDNDISWLQWTDDDSQKELLDFARKVFAITRTNPLFRRRRFFAGGPISGGVKDVSWIRPDGGEMTLEDWGNPKNHILGMLVPGEASDDVDERGRPNQGQSLLLLLNGSNRSHKFALPSLPQRGHWQEVVNTAQATQRIPKGSGINVAPHSLVLLCYLPD